MQVNKPPVVLDRAMVLSGMPLKQGICYGAYVIQCFLLIYFDTGMRRESKPDEHKNNPEKNKRERGEGGGGKGKVSSMKLTRGHMSLYPAELDTE